MTYGYSTVETVDGLIDLRLDMVVGWHFYKQLELHADGDPMMPPILQMDPAHADEPPPGFRKVVVPVYEVMMKGGHRVTINDPKVAQEVYEDWLRWRDEEAANG